MQKCGVNYKAEISLKISSLTGTRSKWSQMYKVTLEFDLINEILVNMFEVKFSGQLPGIHCSYAP